jgi:lipid A 4'-phosphatase
MNRTGFVIALAVAVLVGVVFGVYPGLDLKISAPFYNSHNNLWAVNVQPWVMQSRDAARWLVGLVFAPAFLAIFGKLVWPGRTTLLGGRAALFMILTLALGPGVLTNVILKSHWGRARPIDVTEFKGDYRFTAWWDPRGDCPENCSFIAGEPSGAFSTLAAAALAPPQWRALVYGGALAFGVAVGLGRIGAGAHFFTDVAFAGVFMFLVAWLLHGLVYRWRPTRLSDEAIERPLARVGEGIRGVFALRKRGKN